MTDAVLIRMAEETSKALSGTVPVNPCPHMVPSYNAMLQMAKANHPEDPFLSHLAVLTPTSGDNWFGGNGITVGEMMALLAQLRIALESLQSEKGNTQLARS